MNFFKKFYWLRILFIIFLPIILSLSLFAYPWSFDFNRINEVKYIGNSSKTIQTLKYPYPRYNSPSDKVQI